MSAAERKKLENIGSFDCVVFQPESGWFGESGEAKTPYIRIPVMVTEDGPQKGHCAVYYGWLSDKAFDNTIARLAEVFEFNGDLPALHEGKVTLADLPCNITMEMEEYRGKAKFKVAWLNKLGGGGGGMSKSMPEEKLKGLFAKMGKRAKTIAAAQIKESGKAGGGKAKAPDPQKQAEAPQNDPPPDDDVPF
jgi:hypothetical protein